MKTKTATGFDIEKISDLRYSPSGASQQLWKVSPPIKYDQDWDDKTKWKGETEYVVSSAAVAPFSGPETYIFPANADGEILDFGELPGSYRGGLSHAEAIENLNHDGCY